MADYGSYDSGTGDVISAIQRPALDIPTEQERIRQNIALQNEQAVQVSPFQQANDLINQAIESRRNIEQQRFGLSRQLEGVTNRRQAASIASQIEGLDRASASREWEADQARMMAHNMSQSMAQRLKIDRSTSIDEEGAALMTGLGRLDALRRNGQVNDQQYDSTLLDLGQQYGLGLKHPTAGRMFSHYVEEADRRNQYNLRRTAAEAAKVGARFGVDMQFDESGMPSVELTRQAGLQTPKGKLEAVKQMNDELQSRYGVIGGVGSIFAPVKPHKSANRGKDIELPVLDKTTGKIATQTIPIETFNTIKAEFNDRYFSLFPSAETHAGNAVETQQQASGGLQIGTQRTIGGVPAVWDGKGWKKAQ